MILRAKKVLVMTNSQLYKIGQTASLNWITVRLIYTIFQRLQAGEDSLDPSLLALSYLIVLPV